MNGIETRLRDTLAQVAGSTQVPPLPAFHTAPSGSLDDPSELLDAGAASTARRSALSHLPRRRRAVIAGLATFAIVGGGLTTAASAGLPVLPSAVVQALGWAPVPGAYNADPATVRRILTIPGPDGEPLQLWYAGASHHGYCVALTSVVDTSSAATNVFTGDPANMPRNWFGAGGCSGPVGDSDWKRFGGDATTSSDDTSEVFIVHVPGAAQVELRFATGSSRALPIGDGFTAGWIVGGELHQHPVLVGYAADGSRVGTVDFARFAIDGQP